MQEAVKLMNSLGANRKPFLFIIDFDMKKPMVYPSDEIPADILFKINNVTNTEKANNSTVKDYFLHKTPVSFQTYQKAFDKVISHLKYGNSYLVNLTQPTLLECNLMTGRTHQIRVHLRYAGHPLVGDTLYAPRKKSPFPTERVFLHSWRLTIPHPKDGRRLSFHCALPSDLVKIIRGLHRG